MEKITGYAVITLALILIALAASSKPMEASPVSSPSELSFATGDVCTNGPYTISGDVTIDGNLNVTKNLTVGKDASINGDLYLKGIKFNP